MEETIQSVKTTYTKMLNNINFNITLNSAIDSNVNIKQLLDVSTFLYDIKVDCGNGKAVVSGKIGLKACYIDTDNITNTLTDSQSFNETILDNSITNECLIYITNNHILNNVLSTDANLKISCEVNLKPILFVNLPLNANLSSENMIVKKSEFTINSIKSNVNTSFNYTTTFETKDKITKILYNNTVYNNTKLTCFDNYAVAEGKLYSVLVYETEIEDQLTIKQISECFNIKTDLDLKDITPDCFLDCNFSIDKLNEKISTEIDDNTNSINVVNKINVDGICTKHMSMEIIDDMYCVENEVELSYAKREFIKSIENCSILENTSSDISLTSEEAEIDYLVGNLNVNTEVTNSYIKDGILFLEGVINSNLVYKDENNNYHSKPCEIPFIVNTKLALNTIEYIKSNITICDCKVKVKRGTIIELEYEMCVNITFYNQTSKNVLDSAKQGKPLDFSNYDYQIYLSKPNETIWDICKRVKTTPDNLKKYNKNLPQELTGNEKIIVKR